MKPRGAVLPGQVDDQAVRARLPQEGDWVTTACGGEIRFRKDSPWAAYHDQVVFFCLDICLEDFCRDPRSSCLAGRFLDS